MRCRTCLEYVINNYHMLDENGSNDSRTLAEIIFEIAQIDTKKNWKADFQYVCSACAEKIKTAYEFVLQARKANAEFHSLQEQTTTNDQAATKYCLEEAPIPMFMPFQVKTENDHSSAEDFNNISELTQAAINKDSQENDIKVEDYFLDPIQLLNIIESDRDGFSKDEETSDVEEKRLKTKTRKGKRGRPPKSMRTTRSSSKEHICDVCGKTFIWHKDLIRHRKAHYMDPKLKCDYCDRLFLRKDKLKDHMKTHLKNVLNDNNDEGTFEQMRWEFGRYLYTNSSFRRIQCNLCGLELNTIAEMRNHLPQHQDPKSFSLETICLNLKDKLQLGEELDEEAVKEQICTDIAMKNLDKYYAIVNEHGFELTLSDSDANEQTSELESKKYTCSLCQENFKQKSEIFSHTMEAHAKHDLPFKCEHCGMSFVCHEMYGQHMRRQCENQNKALQCPKCPGRFMWLENYENHTCSRKSDSSDEKSSIQIHRKMRHSKLNSSKPSLQCDQCDKMFAWPKDLTRHMRLHIPDREKFACPICSRKFNRKDNMQVHMKTHGDDVSAETVKKDSSALKQTKTQCVDKKLTKPHGYKIIECMLCQNKLMRITDLMAHFAYHNEDTSFVDRWESISKLKELIYPEISEQMSKECLTARITADIKEGNYGRFYSITNEIGYELHLSSSATESDSDGEEPFSFKTRDIQKGSHSKYVCEICKSTFDRKYKIFKHQAEHHDWQEAQYVCNHCDARFVSSVLLIWHQKRQCKNTLKRYSCRKCPHKFMWKQNLEAHVRISHIPKEHTLSNISNQHALQCHQCKRSFTMQKDLTRHLLMQTCRTEAEVLKCLFCARKFYRHENLHAHIKRHGISVENLKAAESIVKAITQPNGSKNIHCRICNEGFANISLLRTHLLADVNSPTPRHHNFESPLNYTITNSAGFEMQIDDSETEGENDDAIVRSNVAKSPYQCSICNLFAKRKFEMAQHQLSMHKYELLPFKCDICIFRTVSQDILSHHMRSQCFNVEKHFQCDVCQFKFMWPENLENHKKQHHDNPNAEQQKSVGEIVYIPGAPQSNSQFDKTIFQCDQCPCKYNRKDRLSAHIKKVHRANGANNNSSAIKTEKSQSSSQISAVTAGAGAEKKTAPEKKFLCAFCGRSLTSSSNLIIHMRRHTGEKPFKCDFCQMAFPRSSDLLAHRRKHTGEKPHACTICDKKFSRSYKLMLHVRTHTGERPHKCTYCEKSFSQKNDLTLHIRRHTGQRPYVCGICGERFIQGTALRNHRTMRGHYEEVEDAKLPTQFQN